MADIYKIAESWMGIWVHSGPGLSYPHVGVIYGKDNKEYEVSERKNNYWLKIGDNRWCCDRDSNGMIVLKKTGTKQAVEVKSNEITNQTTASSVDEESLSWVPDGRNVIITEEEFTEDIEANFTISNLRGVFGMPYQFMASADPRLSNRTDAIGRKYAKEIVSNMPMLLMTAGKPVFMGGYNEKDRKTILEDIVNIVTEVSDDIRTSILSSDFGKYYTLMPDTIDYFNYVNPMCRVAARYMNLHNRKIDGTNLDNMNWASYVNENFNKLFSVYRGCTAWYCDSTSQISDSFDNDTTESMISSKVNTLSDYGRELNFLLGTVKTETGWALDKFTSMENLDRNMNSEFVQDISNKLGGYGGVFKSLTNSIQTVVAGGRIVFPELWSNSSFNRSYDINLKLVSPDGDDLSIYLNIIVPILHLLAFVLPREGAKSHGFISPFLVRAFYKGLFNVDMGIITNLSINKGKEGAWTKSGIPTVVDVSFTIKDLYNEMYMTGQDDKNSYLNNIILMDYIGNLCGININEPDIIRGIDLYLNNIENKILDTWRIKVYGRLTEYINNSYLKIFGKF